MKDRQKPIEREAEIRAKDFEEVSKGFDRERAMIEAQRCLNCKNAPCRNGCPVGVNIPAFIERLKSDDADGALKVINESNSLPSICGRVCPQETQCEKLCIRAIKGESVAIGLLERYAGAYGKNNDVKNKAKIGKRVAVVGSGPASLTCAAQLLKSGIDVTVYEAFHIAGGVLVYGIPEFRLPKEIVNKEIDEIKRNGAEFCYNTVVGKTITVEQLQKEYDAVFLGTGAGLPMFMNIKGEGLNGVYSANEYLTRVNLMKAYDGQYDTPLLQGKHIAVVGAGNVAMDAARTAVRLGATEVNLLYRRSRQEMPAREEEITHAQQEGVKLNLLVNPIEFLGEISVTGAKCIRMELGAPDASGRRRPIEIKGSEFVIPCDVVIIALGTIPNPMIAKSDKELKVSEKGTIDTNDNLETSLKMVYAGGDAVTGAATVIKAMGAGKKAAEEIIKKFLL
ncbi:MAG: NADPH-dependent glutamate synthase [Clostridia bacterium]